MDNLLSDFDPADATTWGRRTTIEVTPGHERVHLTGYVYPVEGKPRAFGFHVEDGDLEPYQCMRCKHWWVPKRQNMSCLVKHSPGSCCHFNDIRIPEPITVPFNGGHIAPLGDYEQVV